MRKLYIEDVIKEMEYGQVAVKVEGPEGYIDNSNLYFMDKSYLYFDEEDNGILKSGSGLKLNILKPEGERMKFVILDKEVFEKIKGMGNVND